MVGYMDKMRTHFLKNVPSVGNLELSNRKVIKMNYIKSEIWKSHPDIVGIEASTLGRIRILDRVVSSKKMTRFIKGRVLKQFENVNGYLTVNISINGKWATKRVNRLVAQTFIPNPDNLPQVNHKDCNRKNNNVDNLEWCDNSYNMQYREKFGKSLGISVMAVKLSTLEVSIFSSQHEASRVLKISQGNINNVIKGRYNQVGGYWFKEDDGNGIEADKDKLNDIVNGMRFREEIFAVNLNTSEVSRFKSQSEAGRELEISQSNISKVIKGNRKQTHGYWFTNADEKANDYIEQKSRDIEKNELKVK